MTFRYVPPALVGAYAKLGWIDCGPVPGHHGVYSRLMKWAGEGEAPEPAA